MSHVTVEIGSLITRNPSVKGGRPCLTGTGMTVHTLAAHIHQGLSVEDICAEYPDLDRSLILAGLAHYFANKEAIDDELNADHASGEALAREVVPSNLSIRLQSGACPFPLTKTSCFPRSNNLRTARPARLRTCANASPRILVSQPPSRSFRAKRAPGVSASSLLGKAIS